MRFRLKTEFLTFAHGQIRGGLWYKPTWWEAVQKVPPTAVLPRLKKKYIPRIRFVEDRLMREFTARNPSLRTLDERNFARGRTGSVAAQFVAEQLKHMRADKSEAASFDVASTWLVENGRKVLRRVDPALLNEGKVDPSSLPPADAFARVMSAQAELLKSALDQEEAMRRGAKERDLPPLRTFLSEGQVAALDSRTATRAAPVFRRPAPLFDEAEGAEEEQAAAGAEAGQNSSILESGATQRALEELLEGGKPKPAAAPAAGAEGGSSSKDEPLR